jgi:hypothetical protein
MKRQKCPHYSGTDEKEMSLWMLPFGLGIERKE